MRLPSMVSREVFGFYIVQLALYELQRGDKKVILEGVSCLGLHRLLRPLKGVWLSCGVLVLMMVCKGFGGSILKPAFRI